jgi:hypothetical protein
MSDNEYNHAIFGKALNASDPAVWSIAQWLWKERETNVTINARSLAPTREEWKEHVDCGDLQVSQKVEVKQRSFDFTGPQDFKGYSDVIVCAKHSFDNAVPKPYAYCFVDKSGRNAAMILADSRPAWTVRLVIDNRYRNYAQPCYHAPMKYVTFFPLPKPVFAREW